jgi:hypothetical protein
MARPCREPYLVREEQARPTTLKDGRIEKQVVG